MDERETEKFMSYVKVSDNGCWDWTGAKLAHGYPRVHLKRDGKYKQFGAHRVSHEKWKGAIPEGYQIDHLCRNRGCVNPEHLEAVTPQENTIRSIPFQDRDYFKVCPNGHDLTQPGSYYEEKMKKGRGVTHRCKVCWREYLRVYRLRKLGKIA